jgi:hypothetical protein
MAENPGCDVHGQPAGNGFRREAPAEIVGLVGQRLARGVLEAGGGKHGVDQLVDRAGTDHLTPGAQDTLEEVREERPGGPLVAVVAGDEGNSAVAAGTQPGDHGGQDAGELRVHQQQAFLVALGRHDLQQGHDFDLPRAFRTADLRLIHAAICCSRYSSWTCCGVRY